MAIGMVTDREFYAIPIRFESPLPKYFVSIFTVEYADLDPISS